MQHVEGDRRLAHCGYDEWVKIMYIGVGFPLRGIREFLRVMLKTSRLPGSPSVVKYFWSEIPSGSDRRIVNIIITIMNGKRLKASRRFVPLRPRMATRLV